MDKVTKQNNHIVYLQLTAGQGPKECAWVVAQLEHVILKAANTESLLIERVEALAYEKMLRKQDLVEPDAFLSILFRVEGAAALTFARQWQGTIQWQGQSPYRPKHKRINWFVGVEVVKIPQMKVSALEILEQQVVIETMRAKGPGGQHVNKTESAVRITHRPSGLRVRIESDRSQHRNKKIALERLQLLLAEQESGEKQSLERERWLHHYGVKRGSPVRTFFGHNFIENN